MLNITASIVSHGDYEFDYNINICMRTEALVIANELLSAPLNNTNILQTSPRSFKHISIGVAATSNITETKNSSQFNRSGGYTFLSKSLYMYCTTSNA